MSKKGLTSSYEIARYSFSGADAKGYFVVNSDSTEGVDLLEIESLSTLSVQAYEPVGRARALGFRGIKGFAHSVREIAGTLVMTVVNDHPLRPLMKYSSNAVKRSRDKASGYGSMKGNDDIVAAGLNSIIQENTRIGTLLGDFGIFLDYVSEYPKENVEEPRFAFIGVESDYSSNAIEVIDAETGEAKMVVPTELYTDMLTKEGLEQLQSYGSNVAGTIEQKGKEKASYSAINESSGKGDGTRVYIPDEYYDAATKLIYNEGGDNYLKKRYADDIRKIIAPKLNYNTDYSIEMQDTFEGNERAGLFIEGIRIISEGIVTSVNDMVTEMTFQFIAKDLKTISKLNTIKTPSRSIRELEQILQNDSTQYLKLMKELQASDPENKDFKNENFTFTRGMDYGNGYWGFTATSNNAVELKETTKKQRRKMYK